MSAADTQANGSSSSIRPVGDARRSWRARRAGKLADRPLHLVGFDERGDDRPMLAAAVGTGEEMIFAPERDRPDCARDDIGVDLDAAVVEEATNYYKPSPVRADTAQTVR